MLTDTKVIDTDASQEIRDRVADMWDYRETDALIDALVDPDSGKEMNELFAHQG